MVPANDTAFHLVDGVWVAFTTEEYPTPQMVDFVKQNPAVAMEVLWEEPLLKAMALCPLNA